MGTSKTSTAIFGCKLHTTSPHRQKWNKNECSDVWRAGKLQDLTVISRIENVHYNTIQMLLLTLLEFKLANYSLAVFYRILLLTSSLLVLILLSVLS